MRLIDADELYELLDGGYDIDWKTPGQRICVMPRCMKKALAEMEEDNDVV